MDLANINLEQSADDGADLTLRHPVTDEELKHEDGRKMTIRLTGADSSRYRNAMRKQQTKSNGKRVSADANERAIVEVLAECTIGWENIVSNGKEMEFSTANARQLYDDHRWIREQVAEFILDRSNFFQSASNA